MKKGNLWQLSVTTSVEAEDALSELLARLTGCSTALYSNAETGVSKLSVYLARRTDWSKSKASAFAEGLDLIRQSGIATGSAEVELSPIKREDWSESWKRHFKPIEIGAALLIKPSWIKQKRLKNQAVVVLDPGLSFGTGNHPTTAFCLHELVRNRHAGEKQSFVDIGTGSGILAISAAKLGYTSVKAFDFDPEAVRIAKRNAEVNHVADKVKPARHDITVINTPAKPFDVVCANLISNLLIQERQKIKAHVKPGGILVVAGILAREFHEVKAAFEKIGFQLLRQHPDGEWESGAFHRLP